MSTTITVLEVVAENRVILRYALCSGSGNKPGYKSYVPCDVCTGKGVALAWCWWRASRPSSRVGSATAPQTSRATSPGFPVMPARESAPSRSAVRCDYCGEAESEPAVFRVVRLLIRGALDFGRRL
jgi:hypothetical protein